MVRFRRADSTCLARLAAHSEKQHEAALPVHQAAVGLCATCELRARPPPRWLALANSGHTPHLMTGDADRPIRPTESKAGLLAAANKGARNGGRPRAKGLDLRAI